MAHNLRLADGKADFATTAPAWHGLGTVVTEAMTAKEAIELAGLGYEVQKEIMTIEGKNGFSIVVPNAFATKRTDTNEILGTVGNRYQLVQNKEAFNFFDAIIGEDMAMYETAGVLGIGEKVFITAKMPDFIRIAGTDDITEIYVYLTSTHDGSGSIIAGVTSQRIVCSNTLNLALKNSINKVSIRHTKSAKVALESAHKVLGISHQYTTELNECLNYLATKPITDTKVKELVKNVFKSESKDSSRIENIRLAVLDSYYNGVGQEKVIGTAYGVLQGFTHFLSHKKNYRDSSIKLESLMNGESNKVANQIGQMLIAL